MFAVVGACSRAGFETYPDQALSQADGTGEISFGCQDGDGDNCNDCAMTGNRPDPNNDGPDFDQDGLCDSFDSDDDGDGIADTLDLAPTNAHVCRDSDADGCDDCAVTGGPGDPDNDGPDFDADGICDTSDTDDDNDGVPDASDVAPKNASRCGNSDGDSCDDCAISGGPPAPYNDGPDFDGDGVCDASDTDDDDDGVLDGLDPSPHNPSECGDADSDTCDDCAVTGNVAAPLNDGLDFDADGQCDASDTDDDNDGVVDSLDTASQDASRCGDSDGDTCDDCAITNGPPAPANDGQDTDNDGVCNVSDPDDDGDGVLDGADVAPQNPALCADADLDGCDDCAVTGGPAAPNNDGADFDSDGACDASDTDDDNDGVLDGQDPAPRDPWLCGDVDADTCDDCAVSGGPPAPNNDGSDLDSDGTCDAFDNDRDGDGILDAFDPAPLDASICGDADADTCDDCSVTNGPPAVGNDGPDFDSDGACDASDTDDDNDGVPDGSDPSPFDNTICGDADSDTCDDCSITHGPPAGNNDGPDFDSDGTCDASDTDDDNDGVADGSDPSPHDAAICGSGDSDTCDDCAVTNGPPAPNNDGPDFDGDGACDASDTDDDNDGVLDGLDPSPYNAAICGNADADTCDDCSVTGNTSAPNNDGPDFDADGQCDSSDPDDDGDGIWEDGDNSGTPGDNPCQDGQVTNCDDNCQLTANADQEDRDNDAIGDICDGAIVRDTTHMIVTCHNGVVVYSNDDGVNWQRVVHDAPGIDFEEAGYGHGVWLVLGASETILRSTDGINFTTVNTGDLFTGVDLELEAIAFDQKGRWLIGAEQGYYAYSDDGGLSWTAPGVILGGANVEAMAYEAGRWVAAGTNGAIAYTDDPTNAAAWTQQSLGSARIEIVLYADGVWVAAEITGQIHQSTNNAVTWSLASNPGGNLRRMDYGGGYWMVSQSQSILRSTSLAGPWTFFGLHPPLPIQSVFGLLYDEGSSRWVLSLNEGDIGYSDNNGASWINSNDDATSPEYCHMLAGN